MFCENCGQRIEDDSRFCPFCGHPTALAGQQAKEAAPQEQPVPGPAGGPGPQKPGLCLSLREKLRPLAGL